MKTALFLIAIALLTQCSSKPTSSESARNELEKKFAPKVGKATKNDFIEYFGNAEWCRLDSGGDETCRFYKKVATKWVGESKRDKKAYETYDEIVADFDTNGILKSMKAEAQR